MLVRRLFLRWLFIASVVLPAWQIVGWAVFGEGGWGTLGLLITVPAVFLSLLVIAFLVNARPTVRRERAASWTDVAVIGVWQLLIIGTGFHGGTELLFGVLAILAAVAAFWVSIWQLVSDGARRMQEQMAEYERIARQGADGSARPDASANRPPRGRGDEGDGDGDVIIVHEVRE